MATGGLGGRSALALQDDVAGIDGNLCTASSATVVKNTATTAIDGLDEFAKLDFRARAAP